MENYPSNSKISKIVVRDERPEEEAEEAPRVIKKVVEGKVTQRKRTAKSKFFQVFDIRNILEEVYDEILAPAVKEIIIDALKESVERSFNRGGRDYDRRSSPRRRAAPTNYNRMSSSSRRRDRDRDEPRHVSRRTRAVHDLDEIIIESRVEAEEALDYLFELISTYGTISLKDFYEAVGAEYSDVDYKWGWSSLEGARVRSTRDGYMLAMPRLEPI